MANSISGTLNAASPGVESVELSRLSRPAIDVNKVKATTPEEAKKLGQDFEAMFLEEMMRPIFADVSKPNAMFGGGHGEEVFQTMMVQEYAKSFAKRGGIGIAKQIEKIALNNGQKQSEAIPPVSLQNNAARQVTDSAAPHSASLTKSPSHSALPSPKSVDAISAQILNNQQIREAMASGNEGNTAAFAKKLPPVQSLAQKLPRF
ncbi:MAG: rod-binding protein [Alphaproteobacteria bacterium]|nr:rod-binding protein [Alphaproteobacteria bacterium]